MTTLLTHSPTSDNLGPTFHDPASFGRYPTDSAPAVERPLRIAFVNNMPDGAFCSAEQQFGRLLQCTGVELEIRRYVLGGIHRNPAIAGYIRQHYDTSDELWTTAPDALVITGASPHGGMLSEERYWRELCSVLSWGVTHASSMMVSCLAAHAALLHFVGVCRMPMDRKLSGVYQQDVAPAHPLTVGMPSSVRVPHSRKNAVSRWILDAVGYETIIGAGQELWTVATTQMSGCLVLAMQGHPEYDAHTLLLEYRRDVQQYQLGRRDDYPDMPTDYFDPASVDLLTRFRDQSLAARRANKPSPSFPYADLMWRVTSPWKPAASVLFSNWVDELCRRADLPPRRR